MKQSASEKKAEKTQKIGTETLETKPVLAHLRDLRRLLIFVFVLVVAAFVAVFTLVPKQLVAFVSKPITDLGIEIIYTNVSEAFTTQIKLCFIAAVVAASPVIFIALWRFIRPALFKKERLVFGLMAVCAFLLFVTGVLFAYLMVFRLAVNFLIISGETIATPMLSLDKYVTFLMSFLLPFGIVFQMPIVIIILTRLGIVTPKQLSGIRKYIILVVFILAAVLTPPDVVSQVMLGLPMLLLYEAGILLSRLVRPREDA